MDESGAVTLIFYSVDTKNLFSEPFLNICAAIGQMSKLTHVEIAIGSASGSSGEMKNVARVFNDSVGCELTERTGRNPKYTYLQIGCSKAQEHRMLQFARAQVGKPFSNSAMARSLFWPRVTTRKNYFCAGESHSVWNRVFSFFLIRALVPNSCAQNSSRTF